MSELKAYIAPAPDERGLADYYLKSEVDKVIADLEESHKMEVEQLLMEIVELKGQKAQAEDDCAYWKMSEGNAANAMHETEEYAMQLYKELRHQKYKRCEAMAKWCMTEYIQSKCLDFTNTEQWYWRRWFIRWRELAERYKEMAK